MIQNLATRSRRHRWEKYAQRLIRIIQFLARPNTYTIILVAMILLLALGTVLVWLLEKDWTSSPGFQNLDDALVFMLQNVSGVGIGAKPPNAPAARAVGIAFVIIAAAMRTVFVAAVVSDFVNRLILQGKGLRRVDLDNHVIICGWNPRVKQIIKTLQRESAIRQVTVVLLAPINENPLTEFGVKFIKGDPTSNEDLVRADVRDALSAVVITDESDGQPHTDSTYDARAVLTVLALKAANPKLHVVAEARDPANRRHFKNACADEIVVSAEVSEGVVARAATNHGIAWVYEDLLRLDTSPEMYVIALPSDLAGLAFQAALIRLNTRENAILVGVVEGNEVKMCPPNDHVLNENSKLVVLRKQVVDK